MKKRDKIGTIARPVKGMPVRESSELKKLEKELKRTRTKVAKQIEIDERESTVAGLSLGGGILGIKDRILLKFKLKPNKILEQTYRLDFLVKQKNYADAVELFMELNQALQKDTFLNPKEKKEAYRRLYYAYRRMQNAFFPPP